MASVSSLDKDLRNLRLGKYTPQVAAEVRIWIEEALGESLSAGDLLHSLKDGVALCKLVNLASGGPAVRYKHSSMPFVQMENISHFLRACQSPPLDLQPHDLFQTVDLYEAKDPAQVLQCIGAFSRRAHAVKPTIFPGAIGVKSKGVVSPQNTGGNTGVGVNYSRASGSSAVGNNGSATSTRVIVGVAGPARTPEPSTSKPVNGALSASPTAGVSSWSKRTDEAATTPAWNIHQYGYMGGASQGNQGISFGGRRQITSPAPKVPSLAEKERVRREADAKAERLQVLADEEERKLQVHRETEEERERVDEEERWAQQTRLQEDQYEAHADEKRKREEEENMWTKKEASRLPRAREAGISSASIDEDAETRAEKAREQKRAGRDAPLRGQFLSQYQAEQRKLPPTPGSQDSPPTAERRRIQELERELERARQIEKAKQLESTTNYDGAQYGLSNDGYQSRSGSELEKPPPSFHHEPQQRSGSKPRPLPRVPPNSHQNSDEPGHATERDYLRHEWAAHQTAQANPDFKSPLPPLPSKTSRPLPTPQSSTPSLPARPLPVPQSSPPRAIPSIPTNPSSLLAREMERDRLRQQEWEQAQEATQLAAANKDHRPKDGEGGAAGVDPGDGAWDVNQYGYLGGDNQNRGGPGLGIGARRQIIGPRVEVRRG